jgi:murein DD-endopeptidase MepM/ murein hydrolase activator NlpD
LTGGNQTGDALLAKLRSEIATPSAMNNAQRAGEGASASPGGLRTVTSEVSSGFGWRQDPFTGATSFHRGVDVRAAEGTPVASTGAGRVLFSGTDGGYGTSVVVEHANGLTTRYAHLSAALVGAGDLVNDGQILGLVGQSGRATGPHLHYEVRVDGRAVDPLQE